MTLVRAQVSFNADSALPADAMTNVVYFEKLDLDPVDTTDWQNLANDIATMFQTGWSGLSCEVVCRVYDMGDTPPREPKATKVKSPGSHPPSPMPREIAVCLSYYAGRNLPRLRGRIYLPAAVGMASGTLDARPSSVVTAKALALATTANQSLPDIGGVDCKHVVYSQTTRTSHQVTNYWVDNEWDTVRSRGLKPTTRVTAAREG